MMKARIKKTGEIINVITFSCSTNRNIYDAVSYIDSKGVEHEGEHLNYYWDLEGIPNLDAAIDWEQRRYEIAKDVVVSLLQRSNSTMCTSVDDAMRITDELIMRLKEK